MWDFVLNDPGFRKSINGNLGEYTMSRRHTTKITAQAGTLYLVGGHFIAYEIHGNDIYIFDPAPPDGTFGYFMTGELIDAIESRSDKEVVLLDFHTQHHPEDTFCQTWSLVWLIESLRPLTYDVTNGTQGRERLFEIVQKISKSFTFFKWIVKNSEKFCDQLQDVKDELSIKTSKIYDDVSFIKFTREMTEDEFRKIFED